MNDATPVRLFGRYGAAVASGAASPLATVPSGGVLAFTIEARGAAPRPVTTYTVTLLIQPVPTELTIHSVGDSTMADYQISMYPKEWG